MKVLFVTASDITSENGYRTRVISELNLLLSLEIEAEVFSFLHIKYFFTNLRGLLSFVNLIKTLGSRSFIIPILPDNQNQFLYKIVDSLNNFIFMIFLKIHTPDIIHCQNLEATYIAIKSKKSYGIPVIYDMHGAVYEEMSEHLNNCVEKGTVLERIKNMEEFSILQADGIITVSEALKSYVEQKYNITIPKNLILPCSVETKKFNFDLAKRHDFREEIGLSSSDPLFVYSGTTVAYQLVDQVINIFSQLISCFENPKLLLLVPSSDQTKAFTLVENLKCKDKIIVLSVQHDEVTDYLTATDIGFLLRDNSIINIVASPTKFGEYIACGVPVIATQYVKTVASAIQDFPIGYLISNDVDIHKVADFVNLVMSQREQFADNCRKYAQLRYSWDQFGLLLKEFYKSFI